jgi:hypothetical protein
VKQRWVVKPPPPPQIQEHEAAYIEHGRMKAWVDRKICHLVLACWKQGWETDSACENVFSGASHILFRRNVYLQGFMETIAEAAVDGNRIEEVLKERVTLDAGWMAYQKYERRGPVWASDEVNGVIFPFAYTVQFLDCISRKALAQR